MVVSLGVTVASLVTPVLVQLIFDHGFTGGYRPAYVDTVCAVALVLVGLTYIAVASEGHVTSREFTFSGDRSSIRRQAATEALRLLVEEVRGVRRPSS